MKTLTKGQIVYCEPGTGWVRKRSEDIVEGSVEKIGKKYIYIKILGNTYRFHKENLKQVTNYPASYYLYINKQEILDERESLKLYSYIKSHFDPYTPSKRLNLDKLRQIKEVLEQKDSKT